MFSPETIYSKLCRMRGKKGTRTMKHPKRDHYMVTKWSKKDTHTKLGAGKKT
jgi:hypothetical protein